MSFHQGIAGFLDRSAGDLDERFGRSTGTFDPRAAFDPNREFGVDLIDADDPGSSVFTGQSRSFQQQEDKARRFRKENNLVPILGALVAMLPILVVIFVLGQLFTFQFNIGDSDE